MGRPRNHKDVATELARDLADIAGQLATLKGDANAWLSSESYDTLLGKGAKRKVIQCRGDHG